MRGVGEGFRLEGGPAQVQRSVSFLTEYNPKPFRHSKPFPLQALALQALAHSLTASHCSIRWLTGLDWASIRRGKSTGRRPPLTVRHSGRRVKTWRVAQGLRHAFGTSVASDLRGASYESSGIYPGCRPGRGDVPRSAMRGGGSISLRGAHCGNMPISELTLLAGTWGSTVHG